jgi:flagellum-specific ATP synthase
VYVTGSDAETDRAIALFPALQTFLEQEMQEAAPLSGCVVQMGSLLNGR